MVDIHNIAISIEKGAMGITLEPMGRTQKGQAKADRHKPAFYVRLPMVLAAGIDKLVEQHVTDRTTEVITAVREYLERHSLWPPSRRKES